jgi:hypothetical protein
VTGITITAVYRITCDACGVRAEPHNEYHTYAEALAARERVGQFDGWLLRWRDYFAELWCPECVAAGKCRTPVVTSNNPQRPTKVGDRDE